MKGEWSGGKGDAKRKGADDRKYREGWTRIFDQKNKDSKHKK
jgi:hypothetical protein